MSKAVLIDYGCHSFTYRLATRLEDQGFPISYFANGSLESPNLASLGTWMKERPQLVRNIACHAPYGKVGLAGRLQGEIEWAAQCIRALEEHPPAVVIVSTVPLVPLLRIQAWTLRHKIPFVYWLQDFQGQAIHDLLGRRFGLAGKLLGNLCSHLEQRALSRSDMVITIAPGHETHLPPSVLSSGRHTLLENWANIEEIPVLASDNAWSRRHNLHRTVNIVYSGTLGLKHDLNMFYSLAAALKTRADSERTRLVIVSSGQAADRVRQEAAARQLDNVVTLPFQPYEDVPRVLASAAILIAPLDRSAGSFCVPSKILSYLCAGRPTVIAIDPENLAAKMLERARAGIVVEPGNPRPFIAAVASLLDDPKLRLQTGNSARAWAETAFAIDRVVPRFLKILDSAGCEVLGIPQIPVARERTLRATKAG